MTNNRVFQIQRVGRVNIILLQHTPPPMYHRLPEYIDNMVAGRQHLSRNTGTPTRGSVSLQPAHTVPRREFTVDPPGINTTYRLFGRNPGGPLTRENLVRPRVSVCVI